MYTNCTNMHHRHVKMHIARTCACAHVDVHTMTLYLSMYVPVYLSTYLLIWLYAYLSVYLPTYLSIHPSIFALSTDPSIHSSIHPSIPPSIHLPIHNYLLLNHVMLICLSFGALPGLEQNSAAPKGSTATFISHKMSPKSATAQHHELKRDGTISSSQPSWAA